MELLTIPLHHGSELTFELPESDAGQPAEELVNSVANAICKEWKLRKGASRDVNVEPVTLGEWLRPICLKFVEHCEHNGLSEHLYHRIIVYKREAKSLDIFPRSLLSIFAPSADSFSRQERYRYSRELWYAYRHYVPAEFVNGFISQLKGFEQQKALSRIETGFDDWIVKMRCMNFRDTSPHAARGRYPKRIEDRVRQVRETVAEHYMRLSGLRYRKSYADDIVADSDEVEDLEY